MGFRILPGEKHVGRNKQGVCVFSRDQVRIDYLERGIRMLGYQVGSNPRDDEFDDEENDLWADIGNE